LMRYLYLEMPHQQLSLLIVLKEFKFIENYLRSYERTDFCFPRSARRWTRINTTKRIESYYLSKLA
ncbi:hypothetical protein COCMIDRAFT_110324, partial [Bipolaris oryzae ATCC 44560]